ncbi:hypothetical protein A3H22_01110 [Candidatus Peribacteria bacterium RIFCSPLOWO2_12_FULL_55_15]|nr:MAG: hypothetical protein A2789_00780 [Candidatus Peribacteria bacterium RIFCSPHIGHO2_01_FULL_54_22]OGJ62436.1 MAG: hypothetical protein A3D12_01460 [Candidatus Peribacteria bacterium RIFCSPHIGHO2_02_FULL_55_24]OGJ68777.1 MAG: hypothetical protein A2947_02910 [Candidatus Peribacteria bacterium RIFCSPLOWO2_01_FULL_54_110]OGJ69974.1 MAG: hypothetical protein A3H90_02950 [Candidatus Peribacteria bacterium RIFCSPLOWO2_02_FULL_55_36]OGJ70690.1 MAG: hypothetical protein A3H22_01110 [Candidatus Per
MERKWHLVKVLIGVGLVVVVFSAVHLVTRQTPEPPPVVQKQAEIKENEVVLPDHLRHLSRIVVRVRTHKSSGSGILVKRGKRIFIWTAGYIAHACRDTTGEFSTAAWVSVPLVNGTDDVPASVIRYGGLDGPALLELYGKHFRQGEPYIPQSTVFAKEETSSKIGDTVWHTTPFLSLATKGIIKELGRVYQSITYDVTTPISVAGSGGGGVFTEEGICLGMVMLGSADLSCFILPSREIRRWAKAKGVAWAIDPLVPMPSEEELKKLPIED